MSERACASCGVANEADARFCEGCGTALERTCGACGVAASATARFCRACGAVLDERPATADGPTRKTVTVLFADLAGSTAFEEIVDAETAREVIGRYHELLRSTAERHRAGVIKYIGDGFMAVWGVPEIGADDAEHSVEAAVELQERFVGLASRVAEVHGVSLALRVAVNTGEVVVGADDADLVGDALNVGARLESECPHGHVVVGEETWRSTRGRYRYDPMGRIQVKGRSSPVAVYQWSGRSREASDSVAFVGRADELRRIQTVFDDALDNAAARLITIIGDPGVGKSRLAAEFISAHSDARIVRANCAVEGTPALTPIVELLRSRDIEADVPAGTPERERIVRALTGMATGVAGSVEETFWALRRFAEILAAERPLIIVFDDIHWADSLLLDFIEHLAEWARGVPVLMIALTRPELREIRPELVTVGGCVTEAVRLRGLEPSATAELAAQVLGSEQLPVELLGRLPSSTGGNPLFVRELVGMLVHDGVLVPRPDGWRLTVDVDAIAIPPTIQALLASRLERLNAADRRVLEVASVVGTDFSAAAVCVLTGLGRTETKAALDRLRRHDLAQPTGTYSGDEPVWRFHHVLIRDVAYRRLLKSDRAELHERLADWAPGDGARPALRSDEMVARHLEAAVGYRRDLGIRDEHTAELALRSARSYLASAGRALDRDELLSAGTQAARGAAIAAGDAALQAELLLIGCEAFLSAGDVAAGAPLVDELEHVAGESLAPWAICYRCQLIAYTDPSRLLEADERLQGAIDEFSRRKDSTGLAKAHRVRASARGRLGRIGDSEIDLFEALIAARQCGDHRQITAALGAAPTAALWGPSPAPKAGGRCLDVVRMQRMTTAAPSLEATSLRCLAVLELLRGRPDKARSMLADARQVVADLGLRHGLMETELFAGIIELMVGDAVAAEPHFRTALEGLDALGVGADAGQAAALLARSVLAQGRIDEADRYAAESERIAGHNLKTAIAWRAVRAEILSAQGQHDAAVALGREAVAVAADTDLVLDHADACVALSRVLAAAGDDRAAASARRDAQSLYAAKDAVFLVGRTAEVAPSGVAAQTTTVAPTSRLMASNRASKVADAGWQGLQAHDPRAVAAIYSDEVFYDDQRSIRGDSIKGMLDLHNAAERLAADYPNVEWHTCAVRGETLVLMWARLWDDAGNETTSFNLLGLASDGLVGYHGRFDGDNFEDAYRELERRYYAGEGAAFADNGRKVSVWLEAMWRCDVDAARRVVWPDFRWLASPSSLKPVERSVDDFFEWLAERAKQVSSLQPWLATLHWVSPNCYVALNEVQATGNEGQEYHWHRIYVGAYRNGLALSVREFDVEDEDAAFAYAESLVAQPPRRLVVSNAASRVAEEVFDAMRTGDAGAATGFRSEDLVYEDRRHFAGGLITDKGHLGAATAVALAQYSRFETRTLAVRGERLWLGWSRWSDDAGNQATHLHVAELGEGGLFVYEGFFEEDDFWSAYRQLESRYYLGEGAQFAECGMPSAEWVIAISNGDIDGVRRVSHPEFRWIATPSALKDADRTVDDMFRWMQERGRQVSSQRHWVPAVHWLSSNCAVGLGEIAAVGADGEEYGWNFIYVSECRDGLLATAREFDDEEQAFAYAESLTTRHACRLPLTNPASEVADRVWSAMRAHDADAAVAQWSDTFIWNDQRRLSGGPIATRAELRTAFGRILDQYSNFEDRTLAVRGERLYLGWTRWSDATGNETNSFHVAELGDDGRIAYAGRFDEDDFDRAYRELERRYEAGEGKPYSENATLIEMVYAENRGDLDGAFGVFLHPGLRIESRSRSVFPTRTATELRRSVEELGAMVTSYRVWSPAYRWLSNSWVVARHEREAIGGDGETFTWSRLYVGEIRDGMFTSLCEFDVDDEDAAFAYAEERMRAASSRLAITNLASQMCARVLAALRAGRIDEVAAAYAAQFVYDDRRQLSAEPITDRAGMRAASERMRSHYNHFDTNTLAVRGERLRLAQYVCSDDAGNQATGLILNEFDESGLIIYEGRFDENDLDAAYRELEHRYYSDEGRDFAGNGRTSVSFVTALDSLDVEAARRVCLPTFRWFAPPSTLVAQERSLDEFFYWLRERADQVSSVKNFCSVVRWLSPTCFVAVGDVQARGTDGGEYAWARIYVGELRDGLLASMRQFEDEEGAFAYAEERVNASRSRLASNNRASVTAENLLRAMQSHDVEAVLRVVSDDICFDDHRRLSGDPIHGKGDARVAIQRILGQFNRFELRVLAVRGDRLALYLSRWFDDSRNETTYLHVVEVGDDGRIVTDARFDEDDFNGAFRELERRYYSAEGAAFAESGKTATEVMIAGNSGDFDKLFAELAAPGLRVESRSGTIFPDRTVAELRDSVELFRAMVSSSRTWYSAVQWLSPHCAVARQEREAVGEDGERYEWSRIYVAEFEHGLYTAICEFDVEFEEQAFAYAEVRMGAAQARLTVRNRASDSARRLISALRANDVDALLSWSSDDCAIGDRRRLAATSPNHAVDPHLLRGQELLRVVAEGLLRQFSDFDIRTRAVRGERLALCVGTWSDDSGNQSVHNFVFELDEHGRLACLVYFDEDDFYGAYEEFEKRYYEGEGADFAESGMSTAKYLTTKNRGDLDTLFNDLSTADVHIESRSRSVFLDRSAAEYRASLEELNRLVGSVREWFSTIRWLSPRWFIARIEREAIGDEGEQYEWSRIVVGEVRGGRFASACQFEVDDEDTAFAYAEERVRATASPLAVTNAASESADAVVRAFEAGDVDAALGRYSDDFVFEDRRRLSGQALRGKAAVQANMELLLSQFDTFEWRTIAVRGETLALCWNRWCDRSGNESSSLHLVETDHDGMAVYGCRFDEDGFEGAYRELESRYYAGEGEAFAEYGEFGTDYMMTMNRGDFDTMFNELTSPDFRFQNQSRSVFPDRSAEELRANFEDLYAMVASVRSWFSAIHWLSPTVHVGRLEREGLGHDGEQYAWSRILVNQYRDGRLASICEFDAEDEAAALAYAEDLAAQT